MAHTHIDDDAVRITLRMPRELHAYISDSAKKSGRSLNGEIVYRLETSVPPHGFPEADEVGRLPPVQFQHFMEQVRALIRKELTDVKPKT